MLTDAIAKQPLNKNDPLLHDFFTTRHQSVEYCKPLENEDYGLQAAAFASPPKWHLAHTSWFFETFILKPFATSYQAYNKQFEYLFNSYYNSVGEQFPRPQRGLLSRPTVAEVMSYREFINQAMEALLGEHNHPHRESIVQRCILGIQHEKQHQELFFTDIKYSLGINPLNPAYNDHTPDLLSMGCAPRWVEYQGGMIDIGSDPQPDIFRFDNESPKHTTYLKPFALYSRLITNGEYQAFIDDGGYNNPQWWLADGWAERQKQQWQMPLYWRDHDGEKYEFTLHGLQPRNPNLPVCHLSAYEADAFASWSGTRLPTEAEWEHAAQSQSYVKNIINLHPQAADSESNEPLGQLYSSCWQWTSSAYRPYPGFKAHEGAIGEYNGKFMCNQWVLRGGSCVSPGAHLRPTYRNFFYPADRWQFSGLRLAKDS